MKGAEVETMREDKFKEVSHERKLIKWMKAGGKSGPQDLFS